MREGSEGVGGRVDHKYGEVPYVETKRGRDGVGSGRVKCDLPHDIVHLVVSTQTCHLVGPRDPSFDDFHLIRGRNISGKIPRPIFVAKDRKSHGIDRKSSDRGGVSEKT